MGFKRVDLYPTAGAVSTISPASKEPRVKAFAVTGSASATATYAWLPAGSTIVDAKVVIKTACDATNTTLSVGTGSATNSLFSALTCTQATISRVSVTTDIMNTENIPTTADIKVQAQLGGGASTTGEFIVVIEYVV